MSIISLKGPGELVAALAHLLGFHPRHSLVLVAVRGHTRVDVVLRVDLDPGTSPAHCASELTTILARSGSDGVFVAVIDHQIMIPGHAEVHQPLLDAVTTCATAAGICVHAVVWASATTADASWYTSQDHGTVPDPQASILAASLAVAGYVPYPDRDTLVASLDPTDPDAVARRAAQLSPKPPTLPSTHAIQTARAALDGAQRGELPTTDREIIDLAHALAHPRARDAALVITAEHPERASKLWLALTRALPAPTRANPAALLGAAAHLAGNGALASIALDTALHADPSHTLAELLRQALRAGISPDQLRDVIHAAAPDVPTGHPGR